MRKSRWIIALSALTVMVVAGLIWSRFFSARKTVSLVGMVWTSGLSAETKADLDVNSDYQLEKSETLVGWDSNLAGMFLVSDELDLSTYLGKCVRVTGIIPDKWLDADAWAKKNNSYNYERSRLDVENVEVLESNQCIDFAKNKPNTESVDDSSWEYVKLKGALKFASRPAPDISYDFQIVLDTPFVDKQSSTGIPNFAISMWDVFAGSNQIYMQMFDNIGKKVQLEGHLVWGYAESRYLNVEKLTPLK